MEESVVSGIFTLLGVLMGAFINCSWENRRKRGEVRKLTLIEYEKLCEEIREYISDHITYEELKNYYYKNYCEKNSELKAIQRMYFSSKKKQLIGDMENYIWLLLEQEEIQKLFDKLQKDMNKI